MFTGETFSLFATRIQHSTPVFTDGQIKPIPEKNLSNIVETIKSCAPYLKDLSGRWPDVISQLDTRSPEDIYDQIILAVGGDDFETLCVSLRKAKQKIHLLCALCDVAGIWDWEIVTSVLSDFADIAMSNLMKCVADAMGFEASDRGPVPGLFVLALGKYGGRELNYSSDIDLIIFYDPEHIKVPRPDRAEQILVRFVRKLMRGFDEMTPEGYIFRTDLRLRPDPRSNSVAVSTRTAERYYETLGQNWERAAMIKARFCGGDRQAADAFCKDVLRPFIWRRSLDYAAIADIHSIKRQIQGGATVEHMQAAGHHVKLGLGGIREIEFYTQVQQLILGGRHEALRSPRTVDALQALADGNYADLETIKILQLDYAHFRDVEHRIQMYRDEQTHIWPVDSKIRLQLTALCGCENLEIFETNLMKRFARVHKHYTNLFPEAEDLSTHKGSLVFTGVEAEITTLDTLGAYGFERGAQVWQFMADWLGGRIRATRTPRARELLTRLAPRIIKACGATGNADIAFFNFSDFITQLNAGVSLLSLLLNKDEALKTLVDMLAIAPRLAQVLAQQPSLIDAMVEPEFLIQKLDISKQEYATYLDEGTDFETAMNLVRRMAHEDQFSLMASVLRLQNMEKVGRAFSAIAEASITALLPKAKQDIERLYGPLQGEFAILAMGKLGSAEMSYTSDVDIMLVYKPHRDQHDVSTQFNKLTRRFVTSLSSVTEEGDLYEVDMALRPSGRSGPLAVSFEAFKSYYADRAWTWEYMALSRARIVAGSCDEFMQEISTCIGQALVQKDYKGILAHDVLDMHKRLLRDKPAKSIWDIKGAKGGLRDIEFIAQYLVLKHKPATHDPSLLGMLQRAKDEAWICEYDADQLSIIASRYQILMQVVAISVAGVLDPKNIPDSVAKLIAASVGFIDMETLSKAYTQWQEDVREAFSRLII